MAQWYAAALQLVPPPGVSASELLRVIAAIEHALLFQPSPGLPFASVTLRCLTHPSLTQASDLVNADGLLSMVSLLEGPVVLAIDLNPEANSMPALYTGVVAGSMVASKNEGEAMLHGQKFTRTVPKSNGQPTEAPASPKDGSTVPALLQKEGPTGYKDTPDDLATRGSNSENGEEVGSDTETEERPSRTGQLQDTQERGEHKGSQTNQGSKEKDSSRLTAAQEPGARSSVSAAKEQEAPRDTAGQAGIPSGASPPGPRQQLRQTADELAVHQILAAENVEFDPLEDGTPRESTRVWSPPVAVLQLLKDRLIAGPGIQLLRSQ